jgi:hypothetical protein
MVAASSAVMIGSVCDGLPFFAVFGGEVHAFGFNDPRPCNRLRLKDGAVDHRTQPHGRCCFDAEQAVNVGFVVRGRARLGDVVE